MVKVKLGDWITEGFNMLKEQFWPWVLVSFVFFAVSGVLVYTCIGLILIMGVVMFGGHAVALKQLRGGEVTVGDLFSTFSLILPALVFMFLIFMMALPTLLLLGLPMIFIAPLLMFVPHLITDRKMGVIEAMKASYAVVKQDYWMFLLMNIIVGMIANLGVYLCYVGLLATFPLMFTIQAVAYRDCFGMDDACSFKTEDLENR